MVLEVVGRASLSSGVLVETSEIGMVADRATQPMVSTGSPRLPEDVGR